MKLHESMRGFMDLVGPEGSEGPANAGPSDVQVMPIDVDQTSQTTPNSGEVHGAEYDPEVGGGAASMDSGAMGGVASRMRELTTALQSVLGKMDNETEADDAAQFELPEAKPLDEQQQEEESPEAMAPDIDSSGHQSYRNPKGDSHAEKEGFTG